MPGRSSLASPMLIFGSSLLVLCLGLLAYGWSTHAEPGLLTACATPPTGIADYSGKCTEIKWRDTPVTVQVLYGSEGDRAVVVGEMKAINRRVGRHLFEPVSSGGQAAIMLDQAPSVSPREGAITSHYLDPDGYARRAEVRIVNVALHEHLPQVVYHELGHVIGLAHDDYVGSAMRVGSGPDEPISDFDRKLLRAKYQN